MKKKPQDIIPKWSKLFSLQTKLLLLLCSTIIVLVGGCILLFVAMEERSFRQVEKIAHDRTTTSIRKEWVREAQILGTAIADLLVQPVYNLDMATINETALAIQKQSAISSIMILDNNYRIIGVGMPDSPKLGQLITHQIGFIQGAKHFWVYREGLEYLQVISPIQLSKEAYAGYVIFELPSDQISADTEALRSQLSFVFKDASRINKYQIVSLGLIIILVGVLVTFEVARRFAHPIVHLTGELQKVRDSKYDFSLDTSRKDEIGMLNKAFLSMAESLSIREATQQEVRVMLEKEVDQRTEDLQEANAKLLQEMEKKKRSEMEKQALKQRLQHAEKMEALGTLAGGVAHDLNNILSGIVGYPDLLMTQLPEDSPVRNSIRIIKESGNKAAAVVEDLLTLARRGVMHCEPLNLNDVVTDIVKSPEWIKLQTANPKVKVLTDLEPGLPLISASYIHIFKTILNLMRNGVESLKDEGHVYVATKDKEVEGFTGRYDYLPTDHYVLLTVRDTGMGIPKEDQDKIFEPFYTKKKMGRSGTGLGMSVVWGAVKDHDGYIDLFSSTDEGTTIDLYFPILEKQDQQEEIPKEKHGIESLSGNAKILVVDDDQIQCDLAREILFSFGYDVAVTASGEEALSMLKKDEYDLLIIDMLLGEGMDGLDIYKEVISFKPDQKTMIVSGFSESDRVKEAVRLGVGRYLKKPFQVAELAEAVQQTLSGS